MLENLLQLVILFLVIFDPLASLVVFFVATDKLKTAERRKIVLLSIAVAAGLSFAVLFLGNSLLTLFSVNMNDFKVAGGLVLLLLGINMALGKSLADVEKYRKSSASAIAAIIGTPLLTGPAAITSILIARHDYGMLITGIAIFIVLAFTALLFYQSERVHKFFGRTAIQITSTILGLVTIAWGVKFIRAGLGF
ncbi:MAG: MarC family protein [Nanoarchaeota archaeon]|nr:MarC family protein [Nanoarchaeota archaeon]